MTSTYVTGTRCGNCGRPYSCHDEAAGKTWATVIDWRSDLLCPQCTARFDWSEAYWYIDRAAQVYRRRSADDQAWRDAYYIAHVGACNARAVERALARHDLEASHPAMRAIKGHLDYLRGTSLGPDSDDLAEVERQAIRLGLIDGPFRSEVSAL